MSPLDALRLMVDNYPGGRAAIAARLAKPEEVLRKELSGAASHKHGVVDAFTIAQFCAEARSPHANAFVNSVAIQSGGFIDLPVREVPAEQRPERTIGDLVRETSHIVSGVMDAMSDGVISDNERKVIEREAGELIETLQQLLNAVRINNEHSHLSRSGQ